MNFSKNLPLSLIAIFILLILGACGGTEALPVQASTSETAEPAPPPQSASSSVSQTAKDLCKVSTSAENYRIVTTTDVSTLALERNLSTYKVGEVSALPKNERREVRIVVTGPINQSTVDAAMRAAADEVSCGNADIDLVAVLAYEREVEASEAYTLGRLEWAPSGGWTSVTAAIAQPNDRSGYVYSPVFRTKVLGGEPKPTAREIKVYDQMMTYLNAYPDTNEDVLMRRLSKKLGISVKELDRIYLKVAVYSS